LPGELKGKLMLLNRLLRGVDILALLSLVAWLSSLVIIGGEVSVSGDDIEEAYGVSEVILREPVWIALIPLAFALVAIIDFVRNDLRWLWVGGS